MKPKKRTTNIADCKDRFEYLGFLSNTAYLKAHLKRQAVSPLDAFRNAWYELLAKVETNKPITKGFIKELNLLYKDVASFYSLLEELARDVVELYNVKWLKDAMESTSSNRSNSTPLKRI